MTAFEHFYIKDVEANKHGWDQVYVFLTDMKTHIDGLETQKPESFRNREAFTYLFECASFLNTLCTQQAVRLQDLLPRLTVITNMARSVLTMFEDERMEDMTPERCQEIQAQLSETLDGAIDLVNNQKFILPVDDKKTEAANVLEDESDPVLSPDDSYNNLQDAMRLMLRRMKDTDAEGVEALMSPQERLFFEIRENLNKTITNFSTAAAKVNSGRIQFARGTIAVQGRIDRKGLKLIPQHHIVQMAGTAMCPGFSSRDSDIMPPTIFLHDQPFAIFHPDKGDLSFHRVSDTRRDRVQRIRERIKTSSKIKDRVDALESPLYNKMFPGICFVWMPPREVAEALEIKNTITASLAF